MIRAVATIDAQDLIRHGRMILRKNIQHDALMR